jgi:hypothetical protein
MHLAARRCSAHVTRRCGVTPTDFLDGMHQRDSTGTEQLQLRRSNTTHKEPSLYIRSDDNSRNSRNGRHTCREEVDSFR